MTVTSSLTAFGLLTEAQVKTLRRLASTDEHQLELSVDFSLPTGWVYFIVIDPKGNQLHGGVSPEGDAHT